MENVTQAVQDELVKSLDYKLGSSNVNYVQSRKSVQYFPSSLSTFSPTTSGVARIPLTSGMDFIDPESIKIAFRVRNNDATLDLNPGTQEPSCFIKRVQLFANGQRCDDISEYGRCCFLYSLLKPAEWYKNKGNHRLLGARRAHAGARAGAELQGRADGAHAHRHVPIRQVPTSAAQPRIGARICRTGRRPAPRRRVHGLQPSRTFVCWPAR